MTNTSGPSSLLRRLVEGTGSIAAIQLASRALGMGMHLAFARWMGVSEYGSFLFTLATVLVLARVTLAGQDTAAVRFVSEYLTRHEHGKLAAYIRYSRVFVLILALIIALSTALIARLFWTTSRGYATFLLGMCLLPVTSIVRVNAGILRGAQRIHASFAPSRLLPPSVGLATGAAYYYTHQAMPATWGIAALLFGNAAALGIQTSYARSLSTADPRRDTENRQWIRLGVRLMLLGTFVTLLGQTDILVLKALRSSAEVGVYGAGLRLAMLVSIVGTAVGGIAAPMLVAAHTNGDRSNMQRILHYSARLSSSVAAIGFLLLALLGDHALAMFGPSFSRAYQPMLVIAAGATLASLTGSVAPLVSMTGAEVECARIYAGIIVLNLLLNLTMIPTMGIVGAAVSTAASSVLLNGLLAVLARRKLKIRAFPF